MRCSSTYAHSVAAQAIWPHLVDPACTAHACTYVPADLLDVCTYCVCHVALRRYRNANFQSKDIAHTQKYVAESMANKVRPADGRPMMID